MTTRDNQLAIIRQLSRAIEPIPTGESASLKPLHNIEAVLLDVYGTLFISSSGEIGGGDDDASAIALRQVLTDVGLTLLIDEAEGAQHLRNTIADFHGRSRQDGIDFPEVNIVDVWRTTLRSLQRRGQLSGVVEGVDIMALSLRYELATNPVWPMPGAAECLTELANRGIHLGLISNAQWFTPLLFPALLGGELNALGIGSDMQFWSWRTGRAKPGEHLFRLAANALRQRGIEPDRVLHVGNDLLNDVVPAVATGFRTALFAGDQRSLRLREGDARVASITPDVLLTQLRDLLSCVRRHQES
jgi:putative hydrolase of the HAD superfamily